MAALTYARSCELKAITIQGKFLFNGEMFPHFLLMPFQVKQIYYFSVV